MLVRRRRYVFDTETNGLYYEVSKVHLLVMYDLDAHDVLVFRKNHREDTISEGLELLKRADLLVGHNIVNYDLPVLEKLYPGFETEAVIRDTLLCTRLIFSNQKEKDYEAFRKGTLPGKYIGSHSLGAWGHRLGEFKGEYGKGEDDKDKDVWAEWTQDMEDYGVQDVRVTVKLWTLIERQQYPEAPIRFEHQFADLMARQERNGFVFNEAGAREPLAKLNGLKEEIKKGLREKTFRPWWKAQRWKKDEQTGLPLAWEDDAAAVVVPDRSITYKDPLKASRTEGAAFCPIELKEFNPGSRDMVADRLKRLFGWVPKDFTPTGRPKVSEDILRDLVGDAEDEEEAEALKETEEELYERFVSKIPEARLLADYFVIQKRLGQLHDGQNGWLKLVKDDGRIHGSVNTLGTVSRRCSHARPSVSQTPAVRSLWGWEMRSLWTVPKGWVLVGTDLSGIEIRMLAAALAEFDEGEYAKVVVDGDVHSHNQAAFRVPTRDNAKTALYAMVYGSGDAKLGAIVGAGADAGKLIKNNFMRAVPAYRYLKSKVEKQAQRGYVPALDGGLIRVEQSYKALNYKLQSDGALIAKRWALQFEENLLDAGMVHGWHGDFAHCVHSHDEMQIAVRDPDLDLDSYVVPDLSEYEHIVDPDPDKQKKKRKEWLTKKYYDWIRAQSPAVRLVTDQTKIAVAQTREYFNVPCRLDSEYSIGRNWAETH